MELRQVKRVEKTGKVVSDKMEKTRIVLVVDRVRHPFYNKFVKKATRFMAHDEANLTVEGDIVKIVKYRPLSRHKCWKIKEILEKRERGENGAAQVSSNGS
ncbi:30S ribosomal protein S17 [bacterium]|nr:30S ribosomal protein S17 [bacterium]